MLAVLLLTATAPTTVCTASKADSPAIVETVHAMYEAGFPIDEARWRAQLTPDFYIFDEGVRRTGDELIAAYRPLIEGLLHQDTTMKRTFSLGDPRIEVDCNTALATFTTRTALDMPRLGTHKQGAYLDSFWLRKESGRWRIAFQQTTWVPQALPPAPEKK